MRNRGAVVAVTNVSPFGFHSSNVESGAFIVDINFFLAVSQTSTLPLKFPNPAKITSVSVVKEMLKNNKTCFKKLNVSTYF